MNMNIQLEGLGNNLLCIIELFNAIDITFNW